MLEGSSNLPPYRKLCNVYSFYLFLTRVLLLSMYCEGLPVLMLILLLLLCVYLSSKSLMSVCNFQSITYGTQVEYVMSSGDHHTHAAFREVRCHLTRVNKLRRFKTKPNHTG